MTALVDDALASITWLQDVLESCRTWRGLHADEYWYTPDPEIEGWLISGFVPQDDVEQVQLEHLRQELSFDPTLQSHRLTSHPNTAATDAKRVLARLCNGDREREHDCLEREHDCLERDTIHERDVLNGARDFLEEIDQHLLPSFGHRA